MLHCQMVDSSPLECGYQVWRHRGGMEIISLAGIVQSICSVHAHIWEAGDLFSRLLFGELGCLEDMESLNRVMLESVKCTHFFFNTSLRSQASTRQMQLEPPAGPHGQLTFTQEE